MYGCGCESDVFLGGCELDTHPASAACPVRSLALALALALALSFSLSLSLGMV